MTKRLLKTGQALAQSLAGRAPLKITDPAAVPAAVLMPLWDQAEEVQVVFTKRTARLPHHAGQISFPGGVRDPGDFNLLDTALRETQEEIGVSPRQVSVVARLDQVLTATSNFLVTPYVGLLEAEASFAPNPVEVEKLVIVPLYKVLDRDNYRETELYLNGETRQEVGLTHDGQVIWGATARILTNLLDALGPKALQVAALGRSS